MPAKADSRSSSAKMMRPEHPSRAPHAVSAELLLQRLNSVEQGLSADAVQARRSSFGPNRLPRPRPPTLPEILLRQFASPLIYVLMLASVLSLALGEWSDAGFIFAVLVINAAIGAFQELGAERSAQALQELITARARVVRAGEIHEIDATEVVPGDQR